MENGVGKSCAQERALVGRIDPVLNHDVIRTLYAKAYFGKPFIFEKPVVIAKLFHVRFLVPLLIVDWCLRQVYEAMTSVARL